MAYAETTKVPFESSIAEIVRLLRKANADQIAQVEERDRFTIQFSMDGRLVRFRIPFATAGEIERMRGPRRQARDVDQQSRRQRGRALLLVIKAKLESIETGIETFEQAFLANVVMANGETVYDRIATPIADEYRTGAVQPSSTLFLTGPA